jgi:hypothetical protein
MGNLEVWYRDYLDFTPPPLFVSDGTERREEGGGSLADASEVGSN